MKKLLIALALVALLLTWGHSGAQQAEAQAVDLSIRVVTAGCTTAGGPTTCYVPVNTQFTVTMKVEVVPPGPPGDFGTFQGYLTHTAGLTLVKRPGAGEIVWVCDLPAWQVGASWFRGGCTQIVSPPATQPVDVMEVDYTCGASPSTETVTMRHGSATNETYLVDSSAVTHEEVGTESLTIECEEAATEACCFPDGSCTDVDPATCTDDGGTPQGEETTCAEVTCEAAAPAAVGGILEPRVEGADSAASVTETAGSSAPPYAAIAGAAAAAAVAVTAGAWYARRRWLR